MSKALEKAIAAGKADARAAREAKEKADRDAGEARSRNDERAFKRWKLWFKENDRLYGFVRKAVSAGQRHFTLTSSDLDGGRPDAVVVRAINAFEGFSATLKSEEVNMQDSSAPCWVTEYWIVVNWTIDGPGHRITRR